MGLLVWELRRIVFGSRGLAFGLLVEFFEVRGAGLRFVFVGGAFVGEVILRAADHAEVVLAATFLLFWEELPVGPEDFGKVGFFGLEGRGGRR